MSWPRLSLTNNTTKGLAPGPQRGDSCFKHSFPLSLWQQDLPCLYTWSWVGVSCSSPAEADLCSLLVQDHVGARPVSCPPPGEPGFCLYLPCSTAGSLLCPRAEVVCFYSSPEQWIFAYGLKVRGFVFPSHEGRIWGSRQGFFCSCLYLFLQSHQVTPVFPCPPEGLSLVF